MNLNDSEDQITDMSDAICRLSESQAALSIIHVLIRHDLRSQEHLATTLDVITSRIVQDLVDVGAYLDRIDSQEWQDMQIGLRGKQLVDP